MSTLLRMSICLALSPALLPSVAMAQRLPPGVSPWTETANRTDFTSLSPAAVAAREVAVEPAAIAADPGALDVELIGNIVRFERASSERRNDGLTWRGVLGLQPEYQAVLTEHQGVLMGYFSTPGGTYELTTDSSGRQVLLALDDGLFPPCGGAPAGPDGAGERPDAARAAPGPVPADTAAQTDVLIVVTAQTRAALGGTPQAEAFAQSAVDSANTAFANSQMNTRFRLVGVRETARVETTTSLSPDLSWLSQDAEVAGWRNATGADLVSLIVSATAGGACGVGYLMQSPGAGFAGSAFQVTARSCAVGNLSYVHEHGHNMGLTHNPENGSGPSFPYAYGHWVDGSFRTVMSYSNPCTSGCTRRPYFSNPNVSFNGAPTGIADQRDNARAGNNNGDIVSNFRATVVTPALFANSFE